MEEVKNDVMLEEDAPILPEEPQIEPPQRDYAGEVRDLLAARPELRGQKLPQEVLHASVRGKTVTEAYNDYAGRRQKETSGLHRQSRAAKQAAAPIRGVTRGGCVQGKPEDTFLRGFNTEW